MTTVSVHHAQPTRDDHHDGIVSRFSGFENVGSAPVGTVVRHFHAVNAQAIVHLPMIWSF